MRKRIYLAGPMSRGDRIDHLAAALKAFRTLAEKGFAPLCPQLSALAAWLVPDIDHQGWLDIDLPWVEKADAVLRLPGELVGADQEVALANARGIPVYTNLGRLLEGMTP